MLIVGTDYIERILSGDDDPIKSEDACSELNVESCGHDVYEIFDEFSDLTGWIEFINQAESFIHVAIECSGGRILQVVSLAIEDRSDSSSRFTDASGTGDHDPSFLFKLLIHRLFHRLKS